MGVVYKIVVDPSAQRQIDEFVEDYLEKYSLNAAANLYNKILDAVEKAAKIPTAQPLETRFKSVTDTEYRKVTAHPYSIVYRVEEVTTSIIIVVVYHVKRGPTFFNEDLP